MTKSEQIRRLHGEGRSVSEIAKAMGIRYQDARYVLLRDGLITSKTRQPNGARPVPSPVPKPALTSECLLEAGFALTSAWRVSDSGDLVLERAVPKEQGVYVFVQRGVAMYVGVATMGLAKRIYFYMRPGPRQLTSIRLKAKILEELQLGEPIEIYTATPQDLIWNGLPVHGSAGLELGLIKNYRLPWNVRSAGPERLAA